MNNFDLFLIVFKLPVEVREERLADDNTDHNKMAKAADVIWDFTAVAVTQPACSSCIATCKSLTSCGIRVSPLQHPQ